MPNKNYLRGRRFEYEQKKALERIGYTVYRTAGSHGAYDLIAFDPKYKQIELWQCKTKIGNFEPQKEREMLEPTTVGWTVYSGKITKYIRRNK